MVRQPMAETWDAKARRQRLERRRPRVAARPAGGRSLGLLEPAEGLPGGALRAGARAPAACTTARDTAGKQVPDCRCGPCITVGHGAPSAPRARWARDPVLCVDVGRVAADRSLHGAVRDRRRPRCRLAWRSRTTPRVILRRVRSEEHTSELQSHSDLVCRLLLEKKKKKTNSDETHIKRNKRS